MFEEVRSIIVEKLSFAEDSIKEETSFYEDLGVDSLDLFEVVMELEETYSVKISSDDLVELTTVGKVVEYLENKLAC